jgi:hypothetical protein
LFGNRFHRYFSNGDVRGIALLVQDAMDLIDLVGVDVEEKVAIDSLVDGITRFIRVKQDRRLGPQVISDGRHVPHHIRGAVEGRYKDGDAKLLHERFT